MPLSTACSVVLFVGAPGDFFGGKGVGFFVDMLDFVDFSWDLFLLFKCDSMKFIGIYIMTFHWI